MVEWLAEHVLAEPTAIGALLHRIKLWFLRHRGSIAVAGIVVVAAGIAYPPLLTIVAYPVITIATVPIILWGLDLIAYAVAPGKS